MMITITKEGDVGSEAASYPGINIGGSNNTGLLNPFYVPNKV